MSYLPLSNTGSTPFEKLLGHAPEILQSWGNLENLFFNRTTFSKDFLEQVRRALAYVNQCKYCMKKAGPPDKNIEDSRLNTALNFANQFAISHLSIDEDVISELKKYFSNAELIELVAYCSFISASQRLGTVLGLEQASVYDKPCLI